MFGFHIDNRAVRRVWLACLIATMASCSMLKQNDGAMSAKALAAEGMVAIPAGQFVMGASNDEVKREKMNADNASWEQPQHEVTVHRFAIGKYLVTRGDFAQFVAATGYSIPGCNVFNGNKYEMNTTAGWRNPGFDQTDRDPVVCVNLADTEAYIQWYAKKTGHPYRLPSDAEYEYAARAGTKTARYWGDDAAVQCQYGNGADQSMLNRYPNWTVSASCRDGYIYTSPVGSFKPNPWVSTIFRGMSGKLPPIAGRPTPLHPPTQHL